MIFIDQISLAFRTLVVPKRTFKLLKVQRISDTLVYILTIGWITAIISGILRDFGVDYSRPSNAGGSAQLFAAWGIKVLNLDMGNLFEVLVFALLVMIGYIALAIISTIVLAVITWLLFGRPDFEDFPRLSFIAIVYGMTPGFLFGWVPNPFYFVGLWATLWQSLAIKEIFNFSWKDTVIAVLAWIFIVAILHDLAVLFYNFL